MTQNSLRGMRAVGEELWEIEQLFQVKDREDGEDAHPFQLEKKKR